MNRKRTSTVGRVIAVAAIVMVIAIATAFMLSRSGGSDAPDPAHTVAAPEPNSASIDDAGSITMFDRLTVPHPQTWEGAMSEPETVLAFTDRTTCTAEVAKCPRIMFVNLASSKSSEYFGDDPLKQWAEEPCKAGPKGELEGSDLALSGVPAHYYRMQCGPEQEYTRYAWLVPDKQLFVAAYPGDAGALSPEIIQAVLEQAQWK